MPKTKSNKRRLRGISYDYPGELLLRSLIGLDHFLFSSETAFPLSRERAGQRSKSSPWHQLSKQGPAVCGPNVKPTAPGPPTLKEMLIPLLHLLL